MHDYIPVKGSRLSEKQAKVYGDAIYGLIEEQNGVVTPEDVLASAQSPTSPLHDWFEWDDAIAAQSHRRDQAAYLLRSIKVVIKREDGDEELRAFHNVIRRDEQAERVYMDAVRVFSEPEYRAQVVDQAIKELRAWQGKYRQYSELSTVFDAINRLEGEPVVV